MLDGGPNPSSSTSAVSRGVVQPSLPRFAGSEPLPDLFQTCFFMMTVQSRDQLNSRAHLHINPIFSGTIVSSSIVFLTTALLGLFGMGLNGIHFLWLSLGKVTRPAPRTPNGSTVQQPDMQRTSSGTQFPSVLVWQKLSLALCSGCDGCRVRRRDKMPGTRSFKQPQTSVMMQGLRSDREMKMRSCIPYAYFLSPFTALLVYGGVWALQTERDSQSLRSRAPVFLRGAHSKSQHNLPLCSRPLTAKNLLPLHSSNGFTQSVLHLCLSHMCSLIP